MDIDSSDTARENDDYVDGEEVYNDYFSDESSFLGDDDLKAEYEARCAAFDPTFYWEKVHPHSLQTLSAKTWPEIEASMMAGNLQAEKDIPRDGQQVEEERRANIGNDATDSVKQEKIRLGPDAMDVDKAASPPRNPYEGDKMAKQLNESLGDFLNRLKPSTLTIESGPWIWVANPHASNKYMYRNQPRFIDEGSALLEVYMSRKMKLEEQNPNSVPATITRKLKPEREWLADSLLDLAKECSVTHGKWMLFPLPNKVDEIWSIVAKGTLEGRLGSSAKVATDAGDGKPERLMCIYTDDFTNEKDVKRVLKEMRRLGLVSNERGAKRIYYKTDAYTHLGITSDNDYKLKASKYCSKDMLSEIDDELA